MHPSAAPDRQPVEAIGKDDEIPGAGPRCRWNDEPTCTELPCVRCQRLRARARPGQIGRSDAERGAHVGVAQVEDRQIGDVDCPEPAPLSARIDGAARGGAPLGPDRLHLERGVERPWLAGPVVAAIGRSRSIGWQGGGGGARLPVDAAAESAQRRQT